MNTNQLRTDREPERLFKHCPGRWMVQLSLLIAVYLEVTPSEAFLMRSALHFYGPIGPVIVKAVCLAAILAPLAFFLSLQYCPPKMLFGSVAFWCTAFIVSYNIVMNLYSVILWALSA